MANEEIQEVIDEGVAMDMDIQKVKTTGFPDSFNVGYQLKRGIKAFSPNNWKNGFAIY